MKRLIAICIGVIIFHGFKSFNSKPGSPEPKFYSRKVVEDSVFKSAQSLPYDRCILVTGTGDSFQVAILPVVKLTDSAERKLSLRGVGTAITELEMPDSLRYVFYEGNALRFVKLIKKEEQRNILF